MNWQWSKNIFKIVQWVDLQSCLREQGLYMTMLVIKLTKGQHEEVTSMLERKIVVSYNHACQFLYVLYNSINHACESKNKMQLDSWDFENFLNLTYNSWSLLWDFKGNHNHACKSLINIWNFREKKVLTLLIELIIL